MKIFLRCCETCLSLGGCYFEESKMPQQPVHENCHCKKRYIAVPIANVTAKAVCDIRKFSEYVLLDGESSKGKKSLFMDWGYGIMDAENLKNEFESQAIEKYVKGEYTLHKLNRYGQNINIIIHLDDLKTGVTVQIITGWKVKQKEK